MTKLAIVGARLFDGSGSPTQPDVTVLIEGETIKAVGPRGALAVPADATMIEGAGKTVLPGLIDFHVHLRPSMFPLLLAWGVTTVKDVGNQTDRVLAWRQAERDGSLQAPRIYCCGPLVDGDPPFWPGNSYPLDDPSRAAAVADELADRGVDALKTYMMLTLDSMAPFVKRGRERGLTCSAHLGRVTISQAIGLGMAGIEHTPQGFYAEIVPDHLFMDADERRRRGLSKFWAGFMAGWAQVDIKGDKAKRLIDLCLANDVYVDPTLHVVDRFPSRGKVGTDALANEPEVLQCAPALRGNWPAQIDMFTGAWTAEDFTVAAHGMAVIQVFTGELHRAGVKLHASTDTPVTFVVPGHSLHRELALMVGCGLTPAQVLASATSVPAKTLGADDLGLVAPGKRADLLIVDGDPTIDIRATERIASVIRRGHLLDRPALFAEAATVDDDLNPLQ